MCVYTHRQPSRCLSCCLYKLNLSYTWFLTYIHTHISMRVCVCDRTQIVCSLIRVINFSFRPMRWHDHKLRDALLLVTLATRVTQPQLAWTPIQWFVGEPSAAGEGADYYSWIVNIHTIKWKCLLSKINECLAFPMDTLHSYLIFLYMKIRY